MNENNRLDLSSMIDNFDPYSVVTDVLKNLWVIFLGAVGVGMFVYIFASLQYVSTYSTTTTFVVTSQSANSAVYSNLSAAQTMAGNFANILNSDVLKDRVCEDLGLSSFDAQVSSQIIEETNLLTMTVTAESPYKAYSVTDSIIRNYSNLTEYVTGGQVMQVLQQPEVPMGPDNAFSARHEMIRWFIYAFIIFALCFGVLSFRKNTIRTQKDVSDKLAAKPIGVLSHEKKSRGVKVQGRRGRVHLVNHVTASFDYVEHYKKIAMQVTNAAEKIGAKSIMVTSTKRGEGKSTVAANLALTLAKQDYKVMLIDGNLREPALAQIFDRNVEEGKGIAALLNGEAQLKEVLQKDEENNLFYIFGDKGYKSRAAEIISGPDAGTYFERLKKVVDYLIIDTPAMNRCIDAEILAHASDMSLMVTQYDRVSAGEINDAIDSVRESSPKLIGIILNNVKYLPGTGRAVGGYGGYNRYGRYGKYSHYGKYGKYGRYGRYGKYGAYDHYASAGSEEKS